MTSVKSVRIAGIETSLTPHTEAVKLVKSDIKKFLEKERPEILVLPEKWVLEKYENSGEKLSEILNEFCELSDTFGTILVPGSLSVFRSGKLYNSSPVISEGKVAGWADKISLFRSELETYSRGDSIPVFQTGRMVLSVAVCYDLDFPYFSKIAIRKGARILLNPSLIAKQFHSMWHIYVRGRSLENRIPVVSVNAAGVPFEGGSLATWMQEVEGGVILMERKTKNHSFVVEVDYESTSALIEKRMQEDPGTYSFD